MKVHVISLMPYSNSPKTIEYRISVNSFRGNYSFLKLALFTVTFDIKVRKLFKVGNYSRAETIRGNNGILKQFLQRILIEIMKKKSLEHQMLG